MRAGGFLLALTWASVTVAAPLPFDAAWQQVQTQHAGLQAVRTGIVHAGQLADAAKALYLPQVDLKGSYTRLDEPIKMDLMDLNPLASHREALLSNPVVQQMLQALGGTSALVTPLTERDVVTGSVQALWPIYAGGRIDAAQTIRQAQVDEAHQQVALKQQALFETLTERYFGLVLAEAALSTRQTLEKGLDEHLRHATLLEKQGQIAKIERMSAAAALAQAQVATTSARRQVEIARLGLAQLVPQTPQVEPAWPLFINPQLPPLEHFLQPMLTSHPGLRLLEARQTQADGLLTVEKGKRLPEVYLFGNYNLYEQATVAAKMAPDWMVGVGVNIPLVSRDGLNDTVAAAVTTRLQVRDLLTQLRSDLQLLLEKSWREADQAREAYQQLAPTVALARENLRLREQAFNQGLATSLDVEDAQNKVAAVRTQRQAVAYQYVVCLARLLTLSGQTQTFADYRRQGEAVAGNEERP